MKLKHSKYSKHRGINGLYNCRIKLTKFNRHAHVYHHSLIWEQMSPPLYPHSEQEEMGPFLAVNALTQKLLINFIQNATDEL